MALDHHPLDLGDRLAWIQVFRTRPGAVEDRVAPVQTEGVFECIEPFFGPLVTRVGKPSPRLEQYSGPQKPLTIPPVAGTAGGAAEAQNAFVIAVELAALLWRLQPFLLWCRRAGLESGLNHRVLRKEMRGIRHQVLDDRHVRQRIHRCRCSHVLDEPRAREPICAVHGHRAGTANALAA